MKSATLKYHWFSVTLLAGFLFSAPAPAVTQYTITDLGTLGGSWSSASALNEAGQVVGYSDTAAGPWHAFLYSSGVMQDLGTLGGSYSEALDLNEAGQVVGYSDTAAGWWHAFLYSSGVMQDLGTLGGSYSSASALNEAGQVVGYSFTAGDAAYHAFLYSNGVMIDLNSLLPADSGWELAEARFINNAGQIAGYGSHNGEYGLFLMSPVKPADNLKPTASAGPDQTVNEGNGVILDGSGSSDPQGNALSYDWTQIAGPEASLDLIDPVHPTFVAPNVPRNGAVLTFQLIVSDGQTSSDPDTVNIIVKDANHPPVADAGADQAVQEGSPVTLQGSNSFDLDSDPLTYSWVQTAGTPVTLSDPTAAQPGFTAPLVGSTGDTLTFELTVSDGLASATDSVSVLVENLNHAPQANAGPDQTQEVGSLVILNGLGSSDPDADPLTYSWTQVAGPAVTLSDPQSPTPSFTAPSVTPGGETLGFELIVSDGLLMSAPDQVSVTVLNSNDPPVCDRAQAQPDTLRKANRTLVPVEITGMADLDNDQITITVNAVTQDEPVSGLDKGDLSPDAVIQPASSGDQLLLRAEASKSGNGRVYRVQFTASDGWSACTGSVEVTVPVKGKAVDDGQTFDSTQP